MLFRSGVFTIGTIAGKLLLKRDDKVLWLAQRYQESSVAVSTTVADSTVVAATEIESQPYSRSISADLAKKIQEKQLKVDPDRVMLMIKELEAKLETQIKLNQETTAKFQQLEHRANIAEQRLQIVYKFLDKAGIDRQNIYR